MISKIRRNVLYFTVEGKDELLLLKKWIKSNNPKIIIPKNRNQYAYIITGNIKIIINDYTE